MAALPQAHGRIRHVLLNAAKVAAVFVDEKDAHECYDPVRFFVSVVASMMRCSSRKYSGSTSFRITPIIGVSTCRKWSMDFCNVELGHEKGVLIDNGF